MIIYISHFIPSDVGHGGEHRAYQILHDLQEAVGKEQVKLLSLPLWQSTQLTRSAVLHRGSPSWMRGLPLRVQRRLIRYAENPYAVLAGAAVTTLDRLSSGFLAEYRSLIESSDKPVVCVLEQPRFGEVLEINKRYGIPTISCAQNIEVLDRIEPDFHARWQINAAMNGLANELRVLAECAERLVISKVEAGFLGGLGLTVRHYPYRPVGMIYERLRQLHRDRQRGGIDPKLFLLLGTAHHSPTRKSLAWFIDQVLANGLPTGVKVIVAGAGTETLLPSGTEIPGLELAGWIAQADLDQLLRRVRGALCPQQSGFGALTRLSELACAGVPVIATAHAGFAIQTTPGLTAVNQRWEEWYAQLARLYHEPYYSEEGSYARWDESQPVPISDAISQVIGN